MRRFMATEMGSTSTLIAEPCRTSHNASLLARLIFAPLRVSDSARATKPTSIQLDQYALPWGLMEMSVG